MSASIGRPRLAPEQGSGRRFVAWFSSPRTATVALARLRSELQGIDASLRWLDGDLDGWATGSVLLRAAVPLRHCRAAVAIAATVDPAVRLAWDTPAAPAESVGRAARGGVPEVSPTG